MECLFSMTKKQYRFWVNDEELQKFLDSKTSETGGFTEFAKDIFTLVMTNKLDSSSIIDLQRKKLSVDIEYKQVIILIKKKELGFMKVFDSPPSNAAQKAIREGEMNAVDTVSIFDEKNQRLQCPDCGILFTWNSWEEKKIKKEGFVDHYLQSHGLLTTQQQNELVEV